ncbi:hypothetical protein ACFORJ_09505 [Corynebacterium hansenii]|uniref:DUF559 domain-containing protein n=1 Tax=Corynebacterium hansenii TaxID=394964 RepID=A0ABV7ZTD8_9CORY|nr:hypothetical protein [Corynebacterium hansenii]WJZ00986.1 hypothetical protein CHAN_12000 [Corynebacterium hansenii]
MGNARMGGDGDAWPPAPEAVPRTRAELIAGHGIGAERTWRRVRRGMYVPPGADVTPQVRALAEVRARRGAVLSGASAARACGHPWVADRVPEVVLVREPHNSGGVVLSGRRPCRPARACPLQVDGGEVAVLVADPLDVTIDCVAALPDDEAIAFLDGAIRVWGIDRALREWARGGRPGAQRMRELLKWSDWRAESRPESLLRTKLRRAGAGRWVPQFMVAVGGGKRWVDLGDPDYRIAVEFHGEGHWRDAEARRRDALRVNELREVGWCVIEVTILDVFRDFDALLRRIGEHRRRIDAERDGDLAWRRGKAIDAMRMRVNRWLR